MDRPQLTVIIPTTGRDSLERTLRSLLLQQSSLTYEIVVVGDSHAGTWRTQLDTVPSLIASIHWPTNPWIHYFEHDGGEHCVGQPQRQHGMTVAKGRWLSWLGDDDIYLPGAFDAIQRGILHQMEAEPQPTCHPMLFRWISPWKQLYWHTPGFYGDVPGHIDAECIVAPNIPEKLGHWYQLTPEGPRPRYQSDWDFVDSTIKLHGGQVVFRPEIVAQARPSDAEDWTTRVLEEAV